MCSRRGISINYGILFCLPFFVSAAFADVPAAASAGYLPASGLDTTRTASTAWSSPTAGGRS
jgi:hypothetical protein